MPSSVRLFRTLSLSKPLMATSLACIVHAALISGQLVETIMKKKRTIQEALKCTMSSRVCMSLCMKFLGQGMVHSLDIYLVCTALASE